MKNFYLLVLVLSTSFSLFAQSSDFLPNQSTTDVMELGYLKPKLGNEEEHVFIRIGDGSLSSSWAGFMYNINHDSYGDGDDFTIFTYDNRDLVLRPGGTGNIILSPKSHSRIGVGTTNPASTLHVVGDYYIPLRLENKIHGQETVIRFRGFNSTGIQQHADISLNAEMGILGFKIPHNNSSGEGFGLVLKDNGNVGIGEISPNSKLVVRGSIEADGLVFPDGTIQGTAYSGIAESVVSVPYGAVMAFDGDCPDGWEEVVNAQGRMLIGSGAYVEGGETYTYNIGEMGGLNKIQLTIDEMPSHNHGNKVFKRYINTNDVQFNVSGSAEDTYPMGTQHIDYYNSPPSANQVIIGSERNLIFNHTNTNEIDFTGGDQAHENRPPYIAYKICKCMLNNGQNFDARVWTASGDNAYYNKIGNVGIGTTTPQSKLAVNGVITAKEIKAEVDGWGDFVFDENYNLLPLLEVKKYIQSNKHLPKFPTAKEIETNGIALAEMQNKAVQKIEELTLYTIQQEEVIQEQSEKIARLETESCQKEKQIEALMERLAAIEKHLGISNN